MAKSKGMGGMQLSMDASSHSPVGGTGAVIVAWMSDSRNRLIMYSDFML
jgi:hypothetical protein